jgi:6-phosphofructokinase
MARGRRLGILTSGGDSPGLNPAIRALGKSAVGRGGMTAIGFRDGFRGLADDRHVRLTPGSLSGILTVGGTILGTSRDKPHRMSVDGEVVDRTADIVRTYEKNDLDALVCIGGGGTARNALRLVKAGLNVIHIPKTIDNDVAMTDATIGFATALDIATAAIDRLHSTAHSHHRIIVVECMGHRAGWLALGAGLAGGADAILIPEIPYAVERVADAVRRRVARGSNFSIVAVAEGATQLGDETEAAEAEQAQADVTGARSGFAASDGASVDAVHGAGTFGLARELERLTGLESRVTILGYVQRGGTPSPVDRLLATRLGAAAVDLIRDGVFGVMVAARGEATEPVSLDLVAGKRKTVPGDHPWVIAARQLGTTLGD